MGGRSAVSPRRHRDVDLEGRWISTEGVASVEGGYRRVGLAAGGGWSGARDAVSHGREGGAAPKKLHEKIVLLLFFLVVGDLSKRYFLCSRS